MRAEGEVTEASQHISGGTGGHLGVDTLNRKLLLSVLPAF